MTLEDIILTAKSDKIADLVIKNAQLINVITEEILKGRFNERQSIKIMPPAQKMYA